MRIAVIAAIGLALGCNTKQPEPASKSSSSGGGGRLASPLRPHPDYPTPVAAGTDKLFVAEQPDRGPNAPIDFVVPSRVSLTWTTEVNCEATPVGISCGGTRAPDQAVRRWRIGRTGGEVVIADQVRGDSVEWTHVYVRGATGAMQEMVTLDQYARVQSAYLFSAPNRYSARNRNGSNALEGCGSMMFERDLAGRVELLRCLQWAGDSMRDLHGVANKRYVRDNRGFIIDEFRLGLDRTPVEAIDGVHHVRYERDEHGRVTVERYLGIDGKPVALTSGCHGRRFEWDGRGLAVRSTCLDAHDQPASDLSGASTEETTYDLNGCRIRSRIRGLPGGDTSLDHGTDMTVDDRCAVTVRTCLDAKGARRACDPGEPARFETGYDQVGNAISLKVFAADGSAMNQPDFGAVETRWEYDALGSQISVACFDGNGAPMVCESFAFHRIKDTLDDVGRVVSRAFYDIQGAPTANLGSYSMRLQYDNYDHMFEMVGYDAAGKIVEILGMATVRYLYDTAHQRFGMVLLDREGKPARYTGCFGGMKCPAAWQAVRLVRRADGEVTSNEYFDDAGQLIQTIDCKQARCTK